MASVDEMTRQELIARLEELERENSVVEDRLDAMTAQLENIKKALVGSQDDFYQYEFNAENNVLERIQDLEFRASRLENDAEGQDKLEKIIAHAERISNGEDVAVLDYKQVMAAADVSHQTAYTYMDKLVEQTDFVDERPTPDGLKRIRIDTTVSNGFRKGT